MKIVIRSIFLVLLFILINSCSSDEDRLFKAIKRGNTDEVRTLIEEGVSVLTTDKNGLTPLEIARINSRTEIEGIIYEQIKNILEKDIDRLINTKFEKRLQDLKKIDTERKNSYSTYISTSEKLINMITDDKRLNDDLIAEEEKHYKTHQTLIKEFINAKVDMIEDIQREFLNFEYVSNIGSGDLRHIINVNLMYKLSILE